ncbi:MAG: peptidoglycan D,D-transpeptidase FtsI family protein, partial [Acidimicrobiales bacterium]
LLAGVAGEINLETAPDGRTIATGTRSETPAETGATLTLSLDRPLQFEVERMLIAQVEDMAAKGGVVVVMKPGTGEILAMASVVRDEDGDAVTTSENRAVTWSFEPGSITKPLTVAAIIEEGIASPESVRSVPSSMELYDRTFSDSSPHPDSMWTLTDILVKSSNVGTTMWAQELGETKVDQYFRDFGFGELTSLDANFESTGVMPSLEEWSGVSIATIPIGQGISVTPIQMLTSLNTIANGGVYVPPVLVTGAVDGEGNEIELTEPDTHRVVSERTGATVREMMAQVVTSGTGKRAAVTGYQVAGKTGTAWKPFPNGGYGTPGDRLYIASFAGFLPAHAPELSILVTIDEPSNSIYGGSAAAPLFADIAEYAVRRFQIPPNVELVLRDVEVDTTSQPVEDGPETDPTDGVEVVDVEPPRGRGEAAVLPEPVEEEVVLLDDNGEPIPAAGSETAESTGG